MRITNPFQRFYSNPKPIKSTTSGKLWINYTKKISSLEPSSSKNVNIAIKIAAYVSTIFLVVTIMNITLIVDFVSYSYSKIYESWKGGKKNMASESSFSNQLIVGSIGISTILSCVYALRSYGII